WDPVTAEAPLDAIQKTGWQFNATAATPKRADSQDSFQVTALSSNPTLALSPRPDFRRIPFAQKDVLSYPLPSGPSAAIDNDTDPLGNNLPLGNLYLPPRPDSTALRGAGSPNVACNKDGTAWSCGTSSTSATRSRSTRSLCRPPAAMAAPPASSRSSTSCA